jgi:DNA-binding NarL/FixJ family response regulator
MRTNQDQRCSAERPTIRVLIADDHHAVRAGVRQLIAEQHDMEVVAEAADGQEAISMAVDLKPTIVVMDLSMPRVDGPEATRAIVSRDPGVRVIGISRERDRSVVTAMLRAGADGYVLKQNAPRTLALAIRLVAAGRRYIDDAVRVGTPDPPSDAA